jgi:hypothetical protein
MRILTDKERNNEKSKILWRKLTILSLSIFHIVLTTQFRQAWYDQEESYHVRSNL